MIATIHQPSAKAFFSFDRLLLLVRGRMAYSGPISASQPMGYFAAAGYECPSLNNPADFMFDTLVIGANADALCAKLARDGVPDDAGRAPRQLTPLKKQSGYPVSFVTQVQP